MNVNKNASRLFLVLAAEDRYSNRSQHITVVTFFFLFRYKEDQSFGCKGTVEYKKCSDRECKGSHSWYVEVPSRQLIASFSAHHWTQYNGLCHRIYQVSHARFHCHHAETSGRCLFLAFFFSSSVHVIGPCAIKAM